MSDLRLRTKRVQCRLEHLVSETNGVMSTPIDTSWENLLVTKLETIWAWKGMMTLFSIHWINKNPWVQSVLNIFRKDELMSFALPLVLYRSDLKPLGNNYWVTEYSHITRYHPAITCKLEKEKPLWWRHLVSLHNLVVNVSNMKGRMVYHLLSDVLQPDVHNLTNAFLTACLKATEAFRPRIQFVGVTWARSTTCMTSWGNCPRNPEKKYKATTCLWGCTV
jgi:hypothetical protein